jgi:hypothetical protein
MSFFPVVGGTVKIIGRRVNDLVDFGKIGRKLEIGNYRKNNGHHVHQSASYSPGGDSKKYNPNHDDAVTVDLKGHPSDLSSEHGAATAVQRELNQAARGKTINPNATKKKRSGVVSSSGAGTLKPTPTPFFEDVKAFFSLRAAGVSPTETLEIVEKSAEQLSKTKTSPIRIPSK